MTTVRVALTETRNAYGPMPSTTDGLSSLDGKLEDVRRANVDHHVALAEAAADDGAQLVCFGELFTGPYFAVYGEGGGKGTVAQWQAAMGIDWTANRKSIAEAIPPKYSEFIGRQLLALLDTQEFMASMKEWAA